MVKKRVLIVGGVVLLLIAAALFVLHTPIVRAKLLHHILTRLESASGLDITVGSFDYNLFKLRFTCKEVTLKVRPLAGAETTEMPPFFSARQLRLRVPLSLLLNGKLHFKRVEISGAAVQLAVNADGRANFPQGSDEPFAVPRFIVNQFRLENSSLSYTDSVNGLNLEIPAVEVNLAWQGGGQHRFSVETKGGSRIHYADTTVPVDAVHLKGVVGYDHIDIKKSGVKVGQNRLAYSGRLDDFASPRLAAVINGHIDLQDLRELFPSLPLPVISGNVAMAVSLRGPLPGITAGLEVKADHLCTDRLQDLAAAARLKWAGKRLLLTDCDISYKDAKIRARGEFFPFDGSRENRLSLEWRSLDLRHLNPFVDHPFDADLPLRGRLEVGLKRGSLRFSSGDLRLAGTRLNGECTLALPRVSARVHVQARPWQEIVPLLRLGSEDLYRRLRHVEDPAGDLSADITLKGSLDAPEITAGGELKHIAYRGEETGDIVWEAALTGKRLKAKAYT
jgi:hypothetical protein